LQSNDVGTPPGVPLYSPRLTSGEHSASTRYSGIRVAASVAICTVMRCDRRYDAPARPPPRARARPHSTHAPPVRHTEFFNTRFAVGAPLLYVELVYFLRGGNSSFRLYADYRTSMDAARAQTEDGRKKFWRSPIFRRVLAFSVSRRGRHSEIWVLSERPIQRITTSLIDS